MVRPQICLGAPVLVWLAAGTAIFFGVVLTVLGAKIWSFMARWSLRHEGSPKGGRP